MVCRRGHPKKQIALSEKGVFVDVDPIPLTILVAALLTVGFAIAAETSMTTINRGDLRKMVEGGEERAKSVERLLRDPSQLLLTLSLLKTGGVLAAGGAMARVLPDTMSLSELVITGVIAWVVLAALNAAGRSWVRRRTLAIARALAPGMQATVVVLWPFTFLVSRVGRQGGENEVDERVEAALLSDNGLRRLVDAAEEEEPIEESEKQMIASILEMDETVAREVMVPRIDMISLSAEATLQDALVIIMEAGHSRIPVYEENIDQIVGFLYAKDVLKVLATNQSDVAIRTLLRPPYFVPVSKKVNTLLREMQHDRVHIAMVVDEYGGIAGLVTIEDILEEIVGEIQDEYDEDEEASIQIEEPNRYVLNARLDLYTLAKLLDTELPDEDADTLGGLIYSELGHVPVAGETMRIGNWLFTVLSLHGRRIDEVRAELLDVQNGPQPDATELPDNQEDVNSESSASSQLPSSVLKLSPSE
jgi:CBS domain containing-hemolysin-like protein